MRNLSVLAALIVPLLAVEACKDDGNGNDNATDSGTDTATDSGITTSAGVTSGDTTDSATSSTSSGGGSSTGVATTTGGGGIDCDGKMYACTNGLDDDDDGLIDAEDPECTGPCDDDEGSFATGIPGDNMDCKQDCFFDGNSGQGDDGCVWDLKCDPENPGADIGCAYTGGNNCNNVEQNQGCIDFCSGLTPNGCDCFGCCTVQTPDGEKHIFLGSGGDCSLDNIDACSSCTPSEDCNNDCDPEMCEVCFGEDAPPEGCDEPECPDGVVPCGNSGEGPLCPDGTFCVTGCCIDYTPPS